MPLSTRRSTPHSVRLGRALLLVLCVSMMAPAAAVQGNEAFPVLPESIDLALAPGESAVLSVSIEVVPLCIRPFLFGVLASDPTALFDDLTGQLLNGCGGDVSTFEVEFTGDDAPQAYDLLLVDSYLPGTPPFAVATIPVSIHRVPEPGLSGAIGSGSALLLGLWYVRRRSGRNVSGSHRTSSRYRDLPIPSQSLSRVAGSSAWLE